MAEPEIIRPPRPIFTPTRFKDVQLLTDRAYVVKGLIPRDGITVVWGPPKSGKSFWVFDLMMHPALGWQYRGRRVTQGPVVYIACEGERGLGARVEAFRQQLAPDVDPSFWLLTTRLDVAKQAGQLAADIAAQIGETAPVAIVVDTLNRSLVGSESSDEDMAAYIKGLDLLRASFNCAVTVVHHCGVDDKRPRGHTSLAGAADAQIAVRRNDSGVITATVEFMKDGEAGAVINSRLRVVEVGLDEDGEPITSCIVEPTDETAAPARQRPARLPDSARVALEALKRAIETAGEVPPPCPHVPPNTLAVSVELWRRYCYEAETESNPEARRKAFNRASKKLLGERRIGIWNSLAWITP